MITKKDTFDRPEFLLRNDHQKKIHLITKFISIITDSIRNNTSTYTTKHEKNNFTEKE